MVVLVGLLSVVVEGEEDEEGEGPGHEVLDCEAPPVLEDGFPPLLFRVSLRLAELGHGSGELADAIEEHI